MLALYSSAAPVTETIGALQGSGSVGLGAGTLRVGAGDFTGAISDGASAAALSGPNLVGGKLEKYGPGTLKLSGANRYTGTTTVSGGTLQASAANTFAPASAHAVASGAILDLAGHSQTIASMAEHPAVTCPPIEPNVVSGTPTARSSDISTVLVFSFVIDR